ncbi:MAG: hypothetical protein ABI592_14830 [Acidobacteriota bacterium]
MREHRLLRLALPLGFLLAVLACKDGDTTTAPGAVANVTLDGPSSTKSGQVFTIEVAALNIGINSVKNGRVDVTLPAPLVVNSVEASSGTSATFLNGSGGVVTWNLNSLDSNSQSRLHVHATGTLPAGSAAQTVTVRASLTADGIRPGDAVANRDLQLTP